jgi:hypothetical protein
MLPDELTDNEPLTSKRSPTYRTYPAYPWLGRPICGTITLCPTHLAGEQGTARGVVQGQAAPAARVGVVRQISLATFVRSGGRVLVCIGRDPVALPLCGWMYPQDPRTSSFSPTTRGLPCNLVVQPFRPNPYIASFKSATGTANLHHRVQRGLAYKIRGVTQTSHPHLAP